MRVIAFDIGNTRIKWRAGDPGLPWNDGEAVDSALHGDLSSLADRIGRLAFDAAIICNVAGPKAFAQIDRALRVARPGLKVVAFASRERQCGVLNGYREPQ